MRVLALDYGSARLGCAISDPSGSVVSPLAVIEPPDVRLVAELVDAHGVERVVVGLPVSLDGTEGEQAAATRAFCRELEGVLEVSVETYDERLTTRMAAASRRQGAAAAEDSLAAAHLLDSYLVARGSREDSDDG
jgi:putative Holliday junction resolvase